MIGQRVAYLAALGAGEMARDAARLATRLLAPLVWPLVVPGRRASGGDRARAVAPITSTERAKWCALNCDDGMGNIRAMEVEYGGNVGDKTRSVKEIELYGPKFNRGCKYTPHHRRRHRHARHAAAMRIVSACTTAGAPATMSDGAAPGRQTYT